VFHYVLCDFMGKILICVIFFQMKWENLVCMISLMEISAQAQEPMPCELSSFILSDTHIT
jgi:hypothetical protein